MASRTKPDGRKKGWAVLVSVMAGLWVFAVWIGPWLEARIPVFNRIVQTIEKQDIDSGAYFYTEIKASFDGEQYLHEALQMGDPQQVAFTPVFLSGVVLCIVILALGFRYLPMD